MKSSSALRHFLLGTAFLATASSLQAQAPTQYTWNGTTDATFGTNTNWTSNSIAPISGTTNSRLNVNNTDPARPLTWTGSAIYSGVNGGSRALVIGSGVNGNMVITSGTFDSRQFAEDVLGNNGFAGSLTINGGNYINTNDTNGNSDTFLIGLNGAATPGTAGTLNIENGNFISGRIQFGQDSTILSGGIVSIINLNGGTLSTKQFHEQGALGNFGDTGNTAITSTVNFNGGTLRALETGTIMKVNAVDNAVIQANGAIIDTNTFNTFIDKALTAGTGSGGLTKRGAGTLTLTGVGNSYTGATIVKAGTLKLNTATTLSTSSSLVAGDTGSSGAVLDVTTAGLTVASTKTLAGIGTILATGQTVTVNGTLAAGDGDGGGGALAISGGNLTMGASSLFEWDINTAANTSDSVSVGGTLSVLSGANFKVVSSTAFTDAFWDTTRSWNVFGGKDFDAFTLSFLANNVSQVAGDFASEGNFTFTGSGTNLTWTAVPEPSSALVGLLIGAGLLRRRRSA